MFRSVAAVALVAALWGPATVAQAGVYTDDLTKCLVKATSPSDQVDFVAWVFSALSEHPAVASYSNLTEADRDRLSKKVAGLYLRLMTVDCRTDLVTALKYEGSSAIGASFSVVGQVAFRNLMTDPKVAAGLQRLSTFADTTKLKELYKEAGIATDEAAPAAKAH
jgi:hypothetical protein